jgi:hypothetical protein
MVWIILKSPLRGIIFEPSRYGKLDYSVIYVVSAREVGEKQPILPIPSASDPERRKMLFERRQGTVQAM